jgi:hypothetical protein
MKLEIARSPGQRLALVFEKRKPLPFVLKEKFLTIGQLGT